MAFTIVTKSGEKTFADKELVNISSNANSDYQVDFGFQFMLTVQCDPRTNKCVLLNQFHNQKFLFKGKPIPAQLEIDKNLIRQLDKKKTIFQGDNSKAFNKLNWKPKTSFKELVKIKSSFNSVFKITNT